MYRRIVRRAALLAVLVPLFLSGAPQAHAVGATITAAANGYSMNTSGGWWVTPSPAYDGVRLQVTGAVAVGTRAGVFGATCQLMSTAATMETLAEGTGAMTGSCGGRDTFDSDVHWSSGLCTYARVLWSYEITCPTSSTYYGGAWSSGTTTFSLPGTNASPPPGTAPQTASNNVGSMTFAGT